jgi:hypothetical protein
MQSEPASTVPISILKGVEIQFQPSATSARLLLDRESVPLPGRSLKRVRWPAPMTWQLKGSTLCGSGEIVDVSPAGMRFQLDSEFPPPRDITYTFILKAPSIPELPREARLRWFRRPAVRRNAPPPGFLCGAIFKLDDPIAAEKWRTWIAAATQQSQRRNR